MADAPRPGECRTCKAPIYWAATALGKSAPFDAKPNPEGGWWLARKPGGQTVATVAPPHEQPARNRYTSHFATCPNAAQHRRPRDA
jgi:hypothetical protein